MFEKEKNRFVTRSVDSEVPIEIQVLIWDFIDELKEKRQSEMDYLQVFQLTIQDGVQVIINTQEEPLKEDCIKVTVPKNKMLSTRIWVMDDGNYSTMLFPSDY
ncbi:DUF960 family protein [Neobacillus rhizophilus]|uniref:DUF960 domain-containing protein n=1 Tax=Neobacillus rhizophilus TaxID=2833579 RepID=A0A942U0S3_9BACI|nr:DUF960 family protein [Neobacillus rhizophilus]MBS4212436.1 hypothetical protein [Neobacillus rhizophilus]